MRHHRSYPASAVIVLCMVAAFALGTSASGTGSTEPYATYEATVGTDAPATQYRFDEAAGATTLGDSAGTRTATNTAITLGGAGPFGGSKAGAFNGTSSIAAMPSTPLASATAFTAEAWVKWAGGSTNQHVFDLGSSTTSYMYLTPSSSATNSPMRFEIKSGATVFDLDATRLGSNAWHYLAVTEDAGGTLRLYLDGVQAATKSSVTLSPQTLGSTTANWLGRSQTATDPKFSGSVSNVAFYTQALTAARITAHWNAANFPVNTVLPTVSGTTTDGQKLTGATGTWSGLSPITYAYQWRRCDSAGSNCAVIAGATATTYTLTGADVGSKLVLAVTGTNSAGASTATAAATALVAGIAPTNSQVPAITGTASDGQTLTASKGTWSGSQPLSYAYQWRRCDSAGSNCADITGASAATYVITSADVAHKLLVVVTASNSTGSKPASSLATSAVAAVAPSNTALPVISGTPNDGQTLTTSNGTWAGASPISYAYQWQHCNSAGSSCTNLSGATTATYALAAADLGFTIRAVVTATNSVTHTSATSAQTALIVTAPPQNTVAPSISGTASDGQTLIANKGSWSGSAPISYAYQWDRCDGAGLSCTHIAGATATTYLLTPSDDGNELRVIVTATNSRGALPATSAASNVVTPASSGACTDVWNGRAGDALWTSAGNWSAGRVPNSSDRACAGSGSSIHSTSTATAGSVSSQGVLDLASGNFELTDAQTPSSVQDLTLADSGGAATLRGDGILTVTHTLLWNANGALLGHVVLAGSGSGVLQMASGATASMDGAGSFTNNGDFTVAGGTLQGTNGALITNNGTMHVNSEDAGCCHAPGLSFGGFGSLPTLVNHGTLGKSAGTGSTEIDFAIDNEGTVDTTSGTLAFGQGGSHTGSGAGSWIAEPGAANSLAGNLTFDLGSAVQISGALQLSQSVTATDIHGVAAQLALTGGTLTLTDASSTSAVQDLTLSGGQLTGPGSLSVQRTLNWNSGGAVNGGHLTLAASGTGTIATTDAQPAVLDSGGSFTNTGQLTLTSGRLLGALGALITNDGTMHVNSEGGCCAVHGIYWDGRGDRPTLVNHGTLGKSAGTGSTEIDFAIDNEGTVDTTSGTLAFGQGGSHTGSGAGSWIAEPGAANSLAGNLTFDLGSAVQISGALQLSQSVTATDIHGVAAQLALTGGTLTLTDASSTSAVQDLTLSGGQLTGPGSLSVQRTLNWNSGGAVNGGHLTLAASGTGTVTTTDPALAGIDSGGSFTNNGDFTVASGRLQGANGAQITNNGTFHVNAEGGCCSVHGLSYDGRGALPTLINHGTLGKSAGTGSSEIDFAIDNESGGTVDGQSGELLFRGGGGQGHAAGGAWQAEAGARVTLDVGGYYLGQATALSGLGTIAIRGSASAGALTGHGNLELSSNNNGLTLTDTQNASTVDTLTQAGTLSGAATLTITSHFDWQGGSESGSGTTVLAAGATGAFDASGGRFVNAVLDTRTLRNLGTLTFADGYLNASNGATIDNQGTLLLNSESHVQEAELRNVGGTTPQLRNSGTVIKDVGTGTTEVDLQAFGPGPYYEQRGTLRFGGSWNSNAPAVIPVDGTQPTVTVETSDGQDNYYSNGQSDLSIPVTATGSMGVASVKLVDGNGQTLAASNPSCLGGCPQSFAANLTIPGSIAAAGDATLTLVAGSPAGPTESETIEIANDVEPPDAVAANSLDATFDPDTAETDMTWTDASDSGGTTAPAGVADYEYRYQRGAGAWSGWDTTVGADVAFPNSFSGESISIEVRAIDRAGNTSAPTSGYDLAAPTTLTTADSGAESAGADDSPDTTDSDLSADPTASASSVSPLCIDVPSPCGSYNGRAAAAYAGYWVRADGARMVVDSQGRGRTWNQLFNNYGWDDCTNFASQALWSAGMDYMRTDPLPGQTRPLNGPTLTSSEVGGYAHHGTGSWWSVTWMGPIGVARLHDDTESWRLAPKLYAHLTEDYGLARVLSPAGHSPETPKAGDLVFYKQHGVDGAWDHVDIVYQVRKNVIWLVQHSPSRFKIFSIANLSKKHGQLGTDWTYQFVRPRHAAANIQ